MITTGINNILRIRQWANNCQWALLDEHVIHLRRAHLEGRLGNLDWTVAHSVARYASPDVVKQVFNNCGLDLLGLMTLTGWTVAHELAQRGFLPVEWRGDIVMGWVDTSFTSVAQVLRESPNE